MKTFPDFGPIKASTASETKEEFKAPGLPDPRGLKSIILKAADELMQEHATALPVRPTGDNL